MRPRAFRFCFTLWVTCFLQDYVNSTSWLRAAIYVHDISKDVCVQIFLKSSFKQFTNIALLQGPSARSRNHQDVQENASRLWENDSEMPSHLLRYIWCCVFQMARKQGIPMLLVFTKDDKARSITPQLGDCCRWHVPMCTVFYFVGAGLCFWSDKEKQPRSCFRFFYVFRRAAMAGGFWNSSSQSSDEVEAS